MQTSQKKKLDFHTRGTECTCAQYNYCARLQEVGWLLSGTEEFDYTLLPIVANKINSKRFGARLTHTLNRKFVRTDDRSTTQDSEETATAFTASQSSHNSRTKL